MAEGRDPAAGERLRRAFEDSPGWPKSVDGLERLLRERGTPLTATSIRTWFEGTPPQIPNLLKVAPILRRAPLELYAAWFDEPLSSNGLDRIANEIGNLASRLDALAKPAIQAGIADALREAGQGRDDEASPDEPPLEPSS